jgi:hypothetical protein
MRRRSFKAISGLVVLIFTTLALVLAGCDQPTDFTTEEVNIEEKHSLPAPENVKVTPYPGANVITWDLVTNADEYQIIRKGSSDLADVITGVTNKLYYFDVVKFTNQLADGETYTYTVKAIAYKTYNASVASTEVQANIPARTGTVNPILLPTATDITVGATKENGGDYLAVSWQDPAGTVNFAEYTVEYLYGEESDGNPLFSKISSVNGDTLHNNVNNGETSPVHRVVFPLIGGTPLIRVTGIWKDDYYSRVSVQKTADAVTPSILGNVNNFKAVRSPNGPYTTVDLSWSPVTDATGYSVYRSEKAIYSFSTIEPGDTISWEAVDIGTPLTTPISGGEVILTAKNTLVPDDKNYIYLIVATKSDGETIVAKSREPRLAEKVVLSMPNFLDDPILSVVVTNIGDKRATIYWDREDDVTYELSWTYITRERDRFNLVNNGDAAEGDADLNNDGVVDSNDNIPSDPRYLRWVWSEIGEENKIILNPTNSTLADKHQTVLQTLPEFRKSYRFKLVASKAGWTTTDTVDITDNPFNDYDVTLSEFFARSSVYQVYSTDVVVEIPGNNYWGDLTAKLYRAEVEDEDEQFTEWTNWTQVGGTLTFGEDRRKEYTDTNVVRGHHYKYRVEIFSGTTLLEHIGLNGIDASLTVRVQPATAWKVFNGDVGTPPPSFTPIIVSNAPTSGLPTMFAMQVWTGLAYEDTALLRGAQLFIFKEGGGTELLGTIAYNADNITSSPTAIGISRGYYVPLTSDQVRKLRLINEYKIITHSTNGDQQPEIVNSVGVLNISETIVSVLTGTTGYIRKSDTPSIQGRVYWTFTGDNPFPWLTGARLYCEVNGEKVVLGTIEYVAANGINQGTNSAFVPAYSYYITIIPNVWSALYQGTSGSTLQLYKEDLTVEQVNQVPSYTYPVTSVQFN